MKKASVKVNTKDEKGAHPTKAPKMQGKIANNEDRPRHRKRSNSAPSPPAKIYELKVAAASTAVPELRLGDEDEDNKIMRAVTLGSGAKGMRQRKKSISGLGDGSKFKNFKNFVESKIMSKSTQDMEELEVGGVGEQGHGGSSTLGGLTAGSLARDIFKRRSSRTSVFEFDSTVKQDGLLTNGYVTMHIIFLFNIFSPPHQLVPSALDHQHLA
jgi:hypothetical protein